MIRSGIIGTGFMGGVHAKAIRAIGGEVAAFAGSDLDDAGAAADRNGVSRALTPSDLISDPNIDLVHVCTPNALHFDLAMAAIQAGKHVICEKPLAHSYEQARQLASAARDAGVVNAVPFVYRFYPSVREVRARLADDQERVWLVHGHYLQDWLAERTSFNWRLSDGKSRAFADIGVHWCDLLEFTTGHRITRLLAQRSRIHESRLSEAGEVPITTEDGVTMVFETDHGATGTLVVSQATPGRKNELWLSIDGERHSYSFNHEQPNELWVGAIRNAEIVPKGSETSTQLSQVSRYLTTPSGHPQGYQDCFNSLMGDVHAAIAGQSVAGLPTFDDGARAALLTDSVVTSSDTGQWISVPAHDQEASQL